MKNYIATIAFLVVTAGIYAAINHARQAAASSASANMPISIPAEIGSYRQQGPDVPVAENVQRLLETNSVLMRTYRGPTGRPIELAVVYAGSTRRSLHFPEVCIVGQGWEIREQDMLPIGFSFDATKLVLVRDRTTEAVLYWYKTGERLTGSFFTNSWHWTLQQLTKGTATSSMIRISTPIRNNDEESAFLLLEDFAEKLAPILLEKV